MGYDSHDRYLAPLVERAFQHWEARRRAAERQEDLPLRASHAFTVALSREVGTFGTAVAQEIGRRLGWPVYDHELVERIAQEMHVRAALLESVDERQQSWLLESIEAFLSAPHKDEWVSPVSESAFVRHLVETVLALGVHGECVIVGRGAACILPAETTLRVRLVAPVKERIAAMSQKLNLSAREAARRVKTIDRERIHFVRVHFHKDPTDPRLYDLLLNASLLPIGAEAGLVIEALHYRQALAANQGDQRGSMRPLAAAAERTAGT